MKRISQILQGQKLMQLKLSDYLFIYNNSKRENEELAILTEEARKQQALREGDNTAQAEMLERLAQNHIPIETKLKYEKAFIKKLKAWQAKEDGAAGNGYHL